MLHGTTGICTWCSPHRQKQSDKRVSVLRRAKERTDVQTDRAAHSTEEDAKHLKTDAEVRPSGVDSALDTGMSAVSGCCRCYGDRSVFSLITDERAAAAS